MDLAEIPFRTLAIVRGTDRDAALRTVLVLAEEGLSTLEVSLTTPDAFWVIEKARLELGADARLGAGTVITADDAVRAAEAGAGFLVTPGFSLDLGDSRVDALGLPLVIGALTPSEVITAGDYDAVAVKLFPASLGGPRYLRALRDPFPNVPFVPVGGVDLDAAREYLAAGAVAVGVGSPLVGDAANGGDVTELRRRAAEWRVGMAEAVSAVGG